MEEQRIDDTLSNSEYVRMRRERREGLRRGKRRRVWTVLLFLLGAVPLYLLVLRGVGGATVAARNQASRSGNVSLTAVQTGIADVVGRLAFWRNGPVKVRFRVLRPSVAYGGGVGVMGSVTPADLDGGKVRIEERTATAGWRLLESVGVSNKGVFEAKVKPHASGAVRARVPKRGVSREITVTVRPIVVLEPSGTAFWRRDFTLRGKVLPSRAGAVVAVQMRLDGRWLTTRKTTTDEAGAYAFTFKPGRIGAYSYRVAVAGTPALGATVSRPTNVRVWYMVALTFDDGPASPYTDEILSTLRHFRAKATFFVLGQMVKENPGLVRRAVKLGNLIGNHSWSHPTLTRLSDERLNEELVSTSNLIARVSGKKVHWMRPPGGATNEDVNAAARRLGMKVAIWDITTVDWEGSPSYRTVTRRVMAAVKPFDMVLMHDGGGDRSQTAKALRHMIEQLRAKGYLPVTLDQLYPGKNAPEPVLPAERSVPRQSSR